MRGFAYFVVGVGVGVALGVILRRAEEELQERRVDDIADDIDRRLQSLELDLESSN